MSTNPIRVTGGIANALAKKTLPVKEVSANPVIPIVQSQHAATATAYLANWLPAGFSAAANTHHRFSKKCNVTAKIYATPTATRRGISITKIQMSEKSARATRPPTTQNRNSFFLTSNIERTRDAISAAHGLLNPQHNSGQAGELSKVH